MQAPFEAFFLPVAGEQAGQRFCIFHPAHGSTARGAILYVHPFAEEMNKSRRMAALQSRALAQAGFAVLQIDLLGCGDSSGDFGDASWQSWVDDVLRGCQWLGEQVQAPLWLWGLRAGCLLAVDAANQLSATPNLIFWAPSPSGKQVLQQFLRLKAAADMLDGGAKGVTKGLRQQLARGQTIEVAGYTLSPGLALALEQATLTPPTPDPDQPVLAKLHWLELSTRQDATMGLISVKMLEDWGSIGYLVSKNVVEGPAFWQTTEVEVVPPLIDATICAMREISSESGAS